MSKQSKQHDKQFKLDAVRYVKEHPDLTQSECAKNLGIGLSTLSRWLSQYRNFDGDIPTVGSAHYASEEAKEIARLKRELRDTQDALDIWTKVRITKSEISMRTWRSPMSTASQGAFVVIPEISLCDISYIIKKAISILGKD